MLENMIALTPWAVALVTTSICEGPALPRIGPVYCSGVGLRSSLAACSAPACAWSNSLAILSVPRNFGMNTMFSALPGVAVAGGKSPCGDWATATPPASSRAIGVINIAARARVRDDRVS